METVIEESGRIASLALFKEIYKSEKDIYGVISCFLREVIVAEAKHSFVLSEITGLLNETFNFRIPEGVIKTTLDNRLKDFLIKENGAYVADIAKIKEGSLVLKKNEISERNNHIVNQIIDFIAAERKEQVSNIEKEEVIHSFCCFLLDKTNNQKYSEYISAFIIKNKNDDNFIKQLEDIKEGVVLYTGIMFNESINNVGSWDKELTIFLDTEILFDFAGYNNDLYKSLFDEFHAFVKEINQKNKKNLIKLRYFSKTKKCIENYFCAAEHVLSSCEVINPGRPAMNFLLNGSRDGSEIIEKKTLFFDLLRKNEILEDEHPEYYEEDSYKFNIEDLRLEELIVKSEGFMKEDVRESLNMLNLVNIRRENDNSGSFENIKYILLTANNTTLNIAWYTDDIRPSKTVPLATSLHFLTNKFWFKLNKGFGNNTFPRIFDVITKAQIVLSDQLNESISTQFDIQKERFLKGELSKEQIALIIADLKKKSENMGKIDDKNVSFVLKSISQENVNRALEEQEFLKCKAKKNEEEKIRLEIELMRTNALKKKQEEQEREVRDRIIKIEKELLFEKMKNFANLKKEKASIDNKINRDITQKYTLVPIVLLLIFYIALILLTITYGWNSVEPLTYFLGLIPLVIPFAISWTQEETINLIEWKKLRKEKYKIKQYIEYKFDNELYERLKIEIEHNEDGVMVKNKNGSE